MNKTKIPDGYQTVMPYLIVKDAAGLLQFMEKVFDATEKYKVMRDENEKVIMHAEVTIGESTIMFAEATKQWKVSPGCMFIYVENADETYRKALNEGATSLGELSDQSYGRSGGVTDPFGNVWWITSVI